jgi:hypothetical protein
VALPVDFVARAAWLPVVFVAVPVSVFITIRLGLPAYSELILFTEATRCLLDPGVPAEPRGEVALKGKSEPVPVYALGQQPTPRGARDTTRSAR